MSKKVEIKNKNIRNIDIDFDEVEKNVLKEKVLTYEKVFGKNALYEVIREKEKNNEFLGRNDYIEITYKKNGELKHLKIVGDLDEYGEYLLNKINNKYEMAVIKRENGKYFPLSKFEIGDYL